MRDSATCQPSLLCVSAGGENDAVLDYNIKSTGTGKDQPHAILVISVCVCIRVWVRGNDPLIVTNFPTCLFYDSLRPSRLTIYI